MKQLLLPLIVLAVLVGCNDNQKTIDGSTNYGGGSRVPMQNGGIEADADTMETTPIYDTTNQE